MNDGDFTKNGLNDVERSGDETKITIKITTTTTSTFRPSGQSGR